LLLYYPNLGFACESYDICQGIPVSKHFEMTIDHIDKGAREDDNEGRRWQIFFISLEGL
jgi:hypothetical protein